MMVSGGSAGGFLLKSIIISTDLRVSSSRLLRLHQTARHVRKLVIQAGDALTDGGGHGELCQFV